LLTWPDFPSVCTCWTYCVFRPLYWCTIIKRIPMPTSKAVCWHLQAPWCWLQQCCTVSCRA
jgi:Protein of unknown function (DUF2723).